MNFPELCVHVAGLRELEKPRQNEFTRAAYEGWSFENFSPNLNISKMRKPIFPKLSMFVVSPGQVYQSQQRYVGVQISGRRGQCGQKKQQWSGVRKLEHLPDTLGKCGSYFVNGERMRQYVATPV